MARICENGIYRDMTAEELNVPTPEIPETPITDTHRISALESAVADLAMMIMEVSSNG
jgi:hypothetical protein